MNSSMDPIGKAHCLRIHAVATCELSGPAGSTGIITGITPGAAEGRQGGVDTRRKQQQEQQRRKGPIVAAVTDLESALAIYRRHRHRVGEASCLSGLGAGDLIIAFMSTYGNLPLWFGCSSLQADGVHGGSHTVLLTTSSRHCSALLTTTPTLQVL
jgi:hypothetical protein